MKIVLATRNPHKLKEIRYIFKNSSVIPSKARDLNLEILSLLDFPHCPQAKEDGATFKENAYKKAYQIAQYTKLMAVADDSGLVVEALGGRPGIHSSRYAGEEKDYQKNNEKLLKEMKEFPQEKRGAYFICVIAIVSPQGKKEFIEGRVHGYIAFECKGEGGFGYDPLFFYPPLGKTFAELSFEEKNRVSHRAEAFKKLKSLLKKLITL